ncbi:MAG: LptF/LptG family permease [Bacteroidia bacterium]|nr:LptF/LptG family permease [Bacteroidia bacterium]
MKKIDKLLLKSFFPPFLVAFGIAVFILLMQFLWVYLDDIVGKGAGILVIAEMVGYMSISMFPLALPIAVLLSTVMVMGNLSEKYELVSFKSAGVSLQRIMVPLIFACTLIAIFSFVCSNNIIPYANLQFRSRLYDIKKKKPSLSLQEGVFNTDFNGYVMHIKNLDKSNNAIKDVVIYDQRDGRRGNINQIVASEGSIRPTKDNLYLVMKLENGNHYQETGGATNYRRTYPFVKTSFKSWEKVFDLGEFDLAVTNKDLFKNNESMMSAPEIKTALDSLQILLKDKEHTVERSIANYYDIYSEYKIIQDSSYIKPVKVDSAQSEERPDLRKMPQTTSTKSNAPGKKEYGIDKLAHIQKEQSFRAGPQSRAIQLEQSAERDTTEFEEILGYMGIFESMKIYRQFSILSSMKTRITTIQGRIMNQARSLGHTIKSKTKHIYQLNLKYSNALVCLIFLFVGAPMGAIVRRGGFGYPVLIAITFFMLYIVFTLTFKKLTYSYIVSPEIGAWMPCLLMIPVGTFITYRALHDKKILEIDQYITPVIQFVKKMFKRKTTARPTS